jgi:hypothetical protein
MLAEGDRVTCSNVPCASQPMAGTVVGRLGRGGQYDGAGRRVEVELDEEPLPGLGRDFVLATADLRPLEE